MDQSTTTDEGTTICRVKPGKYPVLDSLFAPEITDRTVKLKGRIDAEIDPTDLDAVSEKPGIVLKLLGPPFGYILAQREDFIEIRKVQSFDADDNVTSFYDPAKNSIVRSFETTAGMGLAAVVTQLGFTWMDGLWGVGEDGPGNRAPRSCKVQMSFEPIHDIAPGLDHEGFNRAPIYPVGRLINGIVEGGEQEPYGADTSTRTDALVDGVESRIVYEESFKPNFLGKLF
jgi:hypothetical protein